MYHKQTETTSSRQHFSIPSSSTPRRRREDADAVKQPDPWTNVSVGTFPADRGILWAALETRHLTGHSCSQVLQALNGVNGHTTEEWTRYFTEHHDDLFSRDAEPVATAYRKHASPARPSSFSRASTLVAPVGNEPFSANSERRSRSSHSDMYTEPPLPADTYDAADQGDGSEDDQDVSTAQTRASPSSRSPTPPKGILAPGQGGRYKYTEEDKLYLEKVWGRMVRHDPSVSQSQILKKVAEKARHHSLVSWQSYVTKHPAVLEELRKMTVHRDEVKVDGFLSVRESDGDLLVPPNFRHPRSISDTASSDGRSAPATESDGIELDPIFDGPGDESDDERNIGTSGMPHKPAEIRVFARFILKDTGWHGRPTKKSIELFHREYPQRTITAWQEYYRTNKDEIDRLAPRLRLYKESTAKGKGRGLSEEDLSSSPQDYTQRSVQRKRAHMEEDFTSSEPKRLKGARAVPSASTTRIATSMSQGRSANNTGEIFQ
ncbi:hypothetical protein BC835DRAFT_1415018 [Cytidiella melzeri]|nr:hypothetical protein BC835DRAFT_1415018 [Cytidiella melzeri]